MRKRLAKLMARDCFRNTRLGRSPRGCQPPTSETGTTDVKVVSPYGEIPWKRLSRLSDKEMKDLMIDAVDRCYDFLTVMFCTSKIDEVIEALKRDDPLPQWRGDPELRKY